MTLAGIDVSGYMYRQHLGVLADSHLTLSKHGNIGCKSAFFSISNISRIRKYLDCDNCEDFCTRSFNQNLIPVIVY